ncbi:hypothetical protein GGD56_003242 [Rhizobium mongolense]|uniref:Uncharacterized protein n=1 Tax=Rhizobium mongolense TaxID=57676 RepID=A0ABR6INC0_9HYPH|nr:hypothetical protein [Rhizobium mongolense]
MVTQVPFEQRRAPCFRIELSSVPFKGLPDKDGEFFVNIGPRSSCTLFANGIGIAYRLQEIRCALLANGEKTEMVGIVDLRISGIRDLFRQPIRKHRNRDFADAAEIDEGQRDINAFHAFRTEGRRQAGIDQHRRGDARIAVRLFEAPPVDAA